MFNAFITGSRAYGKPKKSSDVDLVVLVTPEHLEVLAKMADSDDEDRKKNQDSDSGPQWEGGKSKSLRFGRMNLLCLTDPIAYAVWLKGTEVMVEAYNKTGAVDRDQAIKFFDKMRHSAGLYSRRPRLNDKEEDFEEESGYPGSSYDYGHSVKFVRNGKTLGGVITEINGKKRTVTVSFRGTDYKEVPLADLRDCDLGEFYKAKKPLSTEEEDDICF